MLVPWCVCVCARLKQLLFATFAGCPSCMRLPKVLQKAKVLPRCCKRHGASLTPCMHPYKVQCDCVRTLCCRSRLMSWLSRTLISAGNTTSISTMYLPAAAAPGAAAKASFPHMNDYPMECQSKAPQQDRAHSLQADPAYVDQTHVFAWQVQARHTATPPSTTSAQLPVLPRLLGTIQS